MPAAEAEKTPPIVEHATAQNAAGESTAATTPARTDEFEAGNEAVDADVCATGGCDRPAALTYLGRPRCQECYEDDVADGDEIIETPNHEETEMAKSKKSTRKSAKKVTTTAKAPKRQPKATESKVAKPASEAKPKRVSALDAAVQVLRKASKPMRAKEMIAAMAKQGLWQSPAGKTPHATLYAAILREIGKKGDAARFRKGERGQFTYAG